jgi:hypothetical protein
MYHNQQCKLIDGNIYSVPPPLKEGQGLAYAICLLFKLRKSKCILPLLFSLSTMCHMTFSWTAQLKKTTLWKCSMLTLSTKIERYYLRSTRKCSTSWTESSSSSSIKDDVYVMLKISWEISTKLTTSGNLDLLLNPSGVPAVWIHRPVYPLLDACVPAIFFKETRPNIQTSSTAPCRLTK